jgi:hypothetical protein
MEVSSGAEKLNVVQQLAALAARFDLRASQGSDYHGAHNALAENWACFRTCPRRVVRCGNYSETGLYPALSLSLIFLNFNEFVPVAGQAV